MTSNVRSALLGLSTPRITGRPFNLSAGVGAAVTAGAAALVAALAAVALSGGVPSLRIAVAAGLAVLGLVVVAVARYDAAVALGILLIAVVPREPAPTDAVFGLVIVVAVATGRFRLAAVPRTVRYLLGALVAANLLSATAAIDMSRATRFLAITLYLVAFGVWLAGYLDRRRRVRLVVAGYLIAATSSALFGSLALFVGFPDSGALSGDGYRARALFADPNVFGPFLVPATLILLEEWLQPGLFARRRVLTPVCLLVLVAGILFSYSRGAWLNLVVGVVVLMMLRARGRGGGRRAIRLALGAVLALGVTVALIQATGSADFLSQRAHSQGYDSDRFAAQRLGVTFAFTHPLGIGPGQFEVRSPVSSHSLYVRSLAEQGVLGLAVVLALVGGTLALGARNAARRRDLHGLSSLALLAAWCGLLANSFVVDTLHWRHLWLLSALIWATAARRARGQYSSWRLNQRPVSLRPFGARSSHWYMPQRASKLRA